MRRKRGGAPSVATVVAAAVAVVGLAGCSSAPPGAPLADLPQAPAAAVAGHDQAGPVEATPITSASRPTAVASASPSPQVLSKRSVTASEPAPSAVLGSPSIQVPAGSRTEVTAPRGSGPAASEPDSESEPVGPAVSYEDLPGDAYGGPEASVGPISQSSFDLLHVAWNPVAYDEPGRRGYSTSITIAGPAGEDAAYVSWGTFYVGGDPCQLYNILELGSPAYAHAFCGFIEDGSRRFLGRMTGRLVTSVPTASGGTTLVGTFDDPDLPASLELSGRTLYDLAAFTASCSPASSECQSPAQEWDWVSSSTMFHL